jgi:DNA repair protein RadC
LARKESTAKRSFTIHDLPMEERPRERMMKYGADELPVQELLAILLCRGIAGESVVVTAQRLLNHFKSLNKMSEASVEQLMQVKGIGIAKACQIKAAFQLGLRKKARKPEGFGASINSPEDVSNVVKSRLQDKNIEHFGAVLVNTRGKLIKAKEISKGSLDSSIVHPREVFKVAISESAASVIFVHNHPSGIADPSEDDIKLTKRLAEGGEMVGIDVLDHVINGDGKPFSLKRNGLF